MLTQQKKKATTTIKKKNMNLIAGSLADSHMQINPVDGSN